MVLVKRERPKDGSQRYYSDYPERTPVLFLHAMDSTQRKDEVIAKIVQVIEGQERTLHLTLEHPLDIDLFRHVILEKTPVEIKYVGTPELRRLLVWYKGKRVDKHTELIGGTDADIGASAATTVTFAGLGKVYARAMREAIVVRDALPTEERAAFDVNQCAATLATLYTTKRVPQVGEDVEAAS